MLSSNLVSSFYYNNFAAAISEPFTSLNAYRAGVIDANGNILKPESSIDPFEYLIIKLKRIFAELPPGITKSKLSSYIPALQLFSEEAASFGLNKEHVDLLIEGFITVESNGEASYIELVEDMGSANLGGPATSAGANTGSVTGFDLPLGGVLKRKPQQSVLGFEKQACEMYDVCPEDFDLLSNPNLKAWDEVPDSETKRLMQRSQRRNGGSTIIIRDTGTNRYHKVNLMPRNISKMFEGVDLSIFKSVICEQEEVNPDKNLNGSSSTEEVLTYFQDKDKDGHPDGEHVARISRVVGKIFNVGVNPEKNNLVGILRREKTTGGDYAEMHARLLTLGNGLDEIHKIENHDERHSELSNFLQSHEKGSGKSPATSDRLHGKERSEYLPDAHIYDPEKRKTVGAEVKTSTASGSFPTKWPSIGKKLHKKVWLDSELDTEKKPEDWLRPEDLEKTEAGRFRIQLPDEVAKELSFEAALQLVRYGKKTGPRTIIKAEDNNFYEVPSESVVAHWASGIEFPSVKRKKKGPLENDREEGGKQLELTPLKGFINRAISGRSGVKARRITMSRKAYETIRSAADPSLHEHLERLILPHVKD